MNNMGPKSGGLSALQRALAEKRLKAATPGGGESRGILPRVGREPAPMSYAQQRLWFLSQFEPETAAFNDKWAIRIRGSLDVEALVNALNEIIRRHDSLRTTLSSLNGQPVQVISDSLRLAISVLDLTFLPEAEREREIERQAVAEGRRPFDLERGPLIRGVLLRLGAEDHVLVLTAHHTIVDGWSWGVLYHELLTLYDAFITGQASPLPELSIQYADFAVWQRERMQGSSLQKLLTYWKKQLAGTSGVLELPTDRPRQANRTLQGRRHWFSLPRELADKLQMLSAAHGSTLFMTLLTAWKVLLHRYTGEYDLLVGSPVANRNRTETEGLIGCFINMLVLRTNLSGNPTFAQLLKQVRDTALDAYDHQDMPLEKLVEELKVERDTSRMPLVQVTFALQSTPMPVLTASGLTMEQLKFEGGTSQFDLSLIMWSTDNGLTAALEYSTDLFDQRTIARMVGHYQTLLGGIVANPNAPVADLPLLAEEERRALVQDWSQNGVGSESVLCGHELFADHARQAPAREAVRFGERSLAYRELDSLSTQVAHRLRKMGVGPDSVVGLAMEKSLELVVGVLGIWKAGGAYLPLDPAYPRERLAYMLADAAATVIVTQASLLGVLPDHGAATLCLDRDWEDILQEPAALPVVPLAPENLAYVIYTSGSTGRPKGVLVTHRGLPNLVHAHQHVLGVRPGDRILQFASISFDAAIYEITMALCSGATLCMASADELLPGPGLLSTLRKLAVNVVTLPPSGLAQLPEGQIPDIKVLAVAGEPCPAHLVERWAPGLQFFNLYGPTEATVWSTYAQCESGEAPPPIGRPIPGVAVYILDTGLNPVPTGVPGELYIGSPGLARGYLGRPDLTAERFIPDPFSAAPGGRLYRTGDLARYDAAGMIEFLGRADHQVKIRGFRIELGEIEFQVAAHPDVREAVVVAREDSPGHKRLVAYVVPHQGCSLTATDLHGHLRQALPQYMVPAAFVIMEALPVLPNGKIDRRALPAPDADRPSLGADYVVPRNPVEEALARIWAEVLGVRSPGVYDNFFELGGDSIASIQVVARANQAGLPITPKLFFRHQTIAEMAAAVVAEGSSAQVAQAPASLRITREEVERLVGAEVEDFHPLSPYQHWCLHRYRLANDPCLYMIVTNYLVEGFEVNMPAFRRAWQMLVDRHPVLRSVFVSGEGSEQVQAVLRHVEVPVHYTDWRGLSPEEQMTRIRAFVENEYRLGVDLTRAPYTRVNLFQVRDDASMIVWTRTHMQVDGWSFPLMIKDFYAFYEALARGEEPVSDSAVPFRNYIDWVCGQDAAKAEAFWRSSLRGFRNPTPIIPGGPSPANRVPTGMVCKEVVHLSQSTTQALHALARKNQMTLYVLALGAWSLVLSGRTGERDVVFGSIVFGRPPGLRGVETMVGTTLNLLPLRVQVDPSAGLVPWLKEVQARHVEMQQYDFVSLPLIRFWSEVDERHLLFDSYMVFEHFPVDDAVSDRVSGWRGLGFSLPNTGLPLRVELLPLPELGLGLYYYREHMDSNEVSRLLNAFARILEAMATGQVRSLSDLLELTAR